MTFVHFSMKSSFSKSFKDRPELFQFSLAGFVRIFNNIDVISMVGNALDLRWNSSSCCSNMQVRDVIVNKILAFVPL